MGLDVERAVDRLQPLTHADQTESAAPGVVDIEAHAIVDDSHPQTVGLAGEMQRHAARLAVRERVVQCLLSHPNTQSVMSGARAAGTLSNEHSTTQSGLDNSR